MGISSSLLSGIVDSMLETGGGGGVLWDGCRFGAWVGLWICGVERAKYIQSDTALMQSCVSGGRAWHEFISHQAIPHQ